MKKYIGAILILFTPLIFFKAYYLYPTNRTPSDSTHFTNPFIKPSSNLVTTKMQSLSLREKVSQMIISNTIPEGYTENSEDFCRLKKLCEEEKIGGFIFFKGSVSEYARLSNKLQSFSQTPLFISADFERGTKMRITDGNLYPNNMAIGAAGNEKLAYEMGLQIAKESRLIGVHQNYAPVCDVNNNPNNPIINVRSFGEDPELVKRMSEALIKGLQDGNVIATVKHFPGHGDTEIDSHKDLPVLNFDMERLNRTELVPFKNAIDIGVMSVMTAHLSFPVLEQAPNVPSSLSKNIVQGLLIDKLGFEGLVVTDALNMQGITKYFSTSEVAVMCVEAGIDLILMPLDERTSIDAIVNAVQSGRINVERINRSAEKILKAKEWLGLFNNKYVNDADVYKAIDYDNANRIALDIAKESITLVKDDYNFMPVKDVNKKTLILSLSDGKDNLNTASFTKKFSERFSGAAVLEITTDIENIQALVSSALPYENIIIGVFAKVKYGTGKISILPTHSEFLKQLSVKKNSFTVISYGNPYLLKEFPSVPSYICAYGDGDVSIDASLLAVTGAIKFKGRLPVTINEDYKFGMGIEK
ncbi:MAG TPA: glycoside hydrolase family 3 N-terminal domain-containing protein [Ignavibacteria bacterium]|jgi:beta-glucosidase-like glycosyl hydrolase